MYYTICIGDFHWHQGNILPLFLYFYLSKTSGNFFTTLPAIFGFHINTTPAALWYKLQISYTSCCTWSCYFYSSSINQKASDWTVMLSIRSEVCVDDGQHLQTIFQAGFIDHLGGSSRIMLHIAEISCTLAALNFFRLVTQTRGTGREEQQVCGWWKRMTRSQIWGGKVESGAKKLRTLVRLIVLQPW